MEAVRRADPNFVGYRSRTAVDAVERFRRMQKNGFPPTMIPEALIECAKGLSGTETDMFTDWIICPNDVKGIDAAIISRENLLVHKEMVRDQEQELKARSNVKSQNDEKVCDPESIEFGALPALVETQEE